MKTPILGQAYTVRTVNEADNRLVNMFLEVVPSEGLEPGFLSTAPGLRLVATIGSGPVRGLWTFGGYGYMVSGSELYKVTSTYTSTLLGSISGSGPVSMADNGTQLFIAANPDGYVYDSSTSVFQQITDPDFPGAVTVSFLDGYFVFNEPNTQKFWLTALYNGTDIDALDFASAEGSPDLIVSLIVDHREIWLFGNNSIEVWYNAGLADFPMARIQGAFNEIGCAAPYSVAKMDNGLFWLGSDARGDGIVYRANGYTGARISTHAMEFMISQYDDISDAIAYTYQQQGHSFYVLTFPTANRTWCYDVATQLWHERAGWDNGAFMRHRSNCQMFFNAEVHVGDFENGKLYVLDLDKFDDAGGIQKWLRSWRALPSGQNNLKRSAHHSLQLEITSGIGLNSGQGSDPQIMLRWSDDGGHTWSNEHWVSAGKIGEYSRRAIWRRLGMTTKLRDRLYEVSGTDPVEITIMGAELFATPTSA